MKPIAVVDNLVKTPLAERVNQLQKTAPDTDQRQAAQVVEHQNAQKQRQAPPTEKTDEAIIHRDQQQKQQQQEQKKEKKKEQENPGGLDVTA